MVALFKFLSIFCLIHIIYNYTYGENIIIIIISSSSSSSSFLKQCAFLCVDLKNTQALIVIIFSLSFVVLIRYEKIDFKFAKLHLDGVRTF